MSALSSVAAPITAVAALPHSSAARPHLLRAAKPLQSLGQFYQRALLALFCLAPLWARAQGFEKVNTTTNNIMAILITISVAVVTIAIIWAGFKMIFQAARLSDVANILTGGTLVGGAAAFAAYIVS
jgi:type IV secretion system protein VirB2